MKPDKSRLLALHMDNTNRNLGFRLHVASDDLEGTPPQCRVAEVQAQEEDKGNKLHLLDIAFAFA